MKKENLSAEYKSYTISLEPQAEGGFSVAVPALPEVATEGETESEALANAKEAISLALEYRRENNLEIPSDLQPKLHKVNIAVFA